MIRLFGLTLLVFAVGCAPVEEPARVPEAGLASTAEDVHPLLAGMKMPILELTRADGSPFVLDPENMDRPAVLTFYRGGWCPYCNRHLAAFREAEAELSEMGFDVIFLSADAPEVLAPSLDEPDTGYQLVSDQDLEAAKALGIAFRVDQATLDRYDQIGIDLEGASGRSHHGLPIPATFVVGTDGIIRLAYANPNYRVRIDPRVVVAAARAYLDE